MVHTACIQRLKFFRNNRKNKKIPQFLGERENFFFEREKRKIEKLWSIVNGKHASFENILEKHSTKVGNWILRMSISCVLRHWPIEPFFFYCTFQWISADWCFKIKIKKYGKALHRIFNCTLTIIFCFELEQQSWIFPITKTHLLSNAHVDKANNRKNPLAVQLLDCVQLNYKIIFNK